MNSQQNTLTQGHSDSPGVLVHPPLALGGLIVTALVASWFFPFRILGAGTLPIALGSILLAGSLLLILWSVLTFRRAHTNVSTHSAAMAIVSIGPFSISRNPIYFAMLLSFAGFALTANSLWFVFALLVMFILLRFGVISREEEYLTRKFGQPYLDYKAKVPRWI